MSAQLGGFQPGRGLRNFRDFAKILENAVFRHSLDSQDSRSERPNFPATPDNPPTSKQPVLQHHPTPKWPSSLMPSPQLPPAIASPGTYTLPSRTEDSEVRERGRGAGDEDAARAEEEEGREVADRKDRNHRRNTQLM